MLTLALTCEGFLLSKKRYIITQAQNATPVHENFFKSFRNYPADEHIAVLGRYSNPTSIWTEKDKKSADTYAPEVLPFALNDVRVLCKKLKIYGGIHILPTAKRPLSGWEVFCGSAGGIFGHPKHAMEVIPTSTRTPRMLFTTGSCTVPNYTDSKAGKHGEAHHIIGALVVEVDNDGEFFARQVNADKDGCFVDLNKYYTPHGVRNAPNAKVLVKGDIHAGTEDPDAMYAAQGLIKLVKPEIIVAHDLLNFRSANHHETGSIMRRFDKSRRGVASVKGEVEYTVNSIRVMAALAKKLVVVRSNHDEAFEKFLETTNPHSLDAENLPYYFAVWNRMMEYYEEHQEFPNALELEARHQGIPKNVKFLERDEDFTVDGIACGFHGDKGVNGSRGTSLGYSKLGVKTTTGREHTPGIRDGNFRAGLTGSLRQGYNHLPSTWMLADVLQYFNAKRTVVAYSGRRFRVDP